MEVIKTDHLTKYYGKARGIVDLSLSVEEGEFFGFIGPNGAGKSTTIRLLMGLMRATSGSASIYGMNIGDNKKKILENTGYIPSEAMFYPGTTVSEILKLSAGLRHMDCSAEARRLCERLQLDPGKKTDELSLGNRKKTAIVCALQHRPGLYIFDEPTSGLDPLIQKEFFEILQERNAEGATIFLSSHILSEVQRWCSRAAVIREGRLAACGHITELAGTRAKRISVVCPDMHELREALQRILPPDSGSPVKDSPSVHGSSPNQDKNPLRGKAPVQGRNPVRDKNPLRDFRSGGNTASFLWQGDIKELLDGLSQVPYTDITVTEPDLSEIFMHFYEQEGSL